MEASRIRFLESRFRDVFESSGVDVDQRFFTPCRISLLQRIQHTISERGGNMDDVRKEILRGEPSRAQARVIAVTSGKGGVGKTTTALNLALSFQKTGHRTLLFDADLGLANLHVYAGVAPRGTIMQIATGEQSLMELMTDGPGGVRMICGDSGECRLTHLDKNLVECLDKAFKELSASFDVIILDTAAGISQQVLHFLSLADDVLVVTTPNIAATLDAYGMLKSAHQSRLRGKMHVLTNLVHNEEEARDLFEKLRACSDRFLGTAPVWAGWIQQAKSVDQSNQERHPLVEYRPRTLNAKRFMDVARHLVPDHEQKNEEPVAAPRPSLARTALTGSQL